MAIVGLAYLLEDIFHLSKGWYFIVCLNIIYVLVVTKFSLPIIKQIKAKKEGIILIICIQFLLPFFSTDFSKKTTDC